MNFYDQEKFGMYTFIVNIILTLFLLTTETTFLYYLITIVSNTFAIILNTMIIKTNVKNLLNIISLIANIIVPNIVILSMMIKYNII